MFRSNANVHKVKICAVWYTIKGNTQVLYSHMEVSLELLVAKGINSCAAQAHRPKLLLHTRECLSHRDVLSLSRIAMKGNLLIVSLFFTIVQGKPASRARPRNAVRKFKIY